MKEFFIAAAALSLLAGCSDNNADTDGDGIISDGELVAEMAAAESEFERKAGQWEMTSEYLDVKAAGAGGNSAAIAERMKGRTTTVKICITEEQIKNAREDMLKMNQEANCEYKKFSMSGGKIEAEISCPGPQKVEATITGEYSPTTSVMISHMIMHDLGEATTMDVTRKMTGKWIGECPG